MISIRKGYHKFAGLVDDFFHFDSILSYKVRVDKGGFVAHPGRASLTLFVRVRKNYSYFNSYFLEKYECFLN